MKKILLILIGAVFMNTTLFAQCSEIYFSEYVEGGGNNKALELYNPTGSAINLSSYKILTISNGGPSTTELDLSGMIPSYGTYVVSADQASSQTLAVRDTSLSFPSVVHFNGDDAVVLLKGTDTIDCIGERYVRPSGSWTVGSGSTKDYTLVRKSTVKQGNIDWSSAVNEWDVLPKDTVRDLGQHTSDCFVPANTIVSFKQGSLNVSEGAGTLNVDITIQAEKTTATEVTVSVTGGTAVYGTDFNSVDPTKITFPASSGASQTYSISIIDNGTIGPDKTIILALSAPTNGALLGSDSVLTITIEDDDYRVTTIAAARTADADLNITNDDEKVEVKGVVYGIDYDENAGYSFSLIDATGAINIFNFNDVSNYTVTEGDELTVRGTMDFYNGLTEIKADSIKVESSGNTLKNPIVVNAPSEATESEFIKVEKIWVADTTTVWPSNGNVLFTNEDMDTFQVRIDAATMDIAGTSIMDDTMSITGIGGQFDRNAPYNEGYQVFPRKLADIEEWEDKSSVRDLNFISRVYPNPTNGLTTIESLQPISKIEVSAISGHHVLAIDGDQNLSQTINLSELSAGFYVITVQSGSQSSQIKIAVQ